MTPRCPHCGNDLPSELAQHSLAPISVLVSCPHCGKEVHLEAPSSAPSAAEGPGGDTRGRPSSAAFEPPRPSGGKGDKEAERSESFSGHETVSGVMEELREHHEKE